MNNNINMNTKFILYYTDLICQKIDLKTDAFIKQIAAKRNNDPQTVEFIQEMSLVPLSQQIGYLINKVLDLLGKGEHHGRE